MEDFFLDNNAIEEKIDEKNNETRQKLKRYTTTRIKSRKFLPNISNNDVKEEDLHDRSFIFNVYMLITKNLNPFSLKRYIFDVDNRNLVRIFWEECIDQEFFK